VEEEENDNKVAGSIKIKDEVESTQKIWIDEPELRNKN